MSRVQLRTVWHSLWPSDVQDGMTHILDQGETVWIVLIVFSTTSLPLCELAGIDCYIWLRLGPKHEQGLFREMWATLKTVPMRSWRMPLLSLDVFLCRHVCLGCILSKDLFNSYLVVFWLTLLGVKLDVLHLNWLNGFRISYRVFFGLPVRLDMSTGLSLWCLVVILQVLGATSFALWNIPGWFSICRLWPKICPEEIRAIQASAWLYGTIRTRIPLLALVVWGYQTWRFSSSTHPTSAFPCTGMWTPGATTSCQSSGTRFGGSCL